MTTPTDNAAHGTTIVVCCHIAAINMIPRVAEHSSARHPVGNSWLPSQYMVTHCTWDGVP